MGASKTASYTAQEISIARIAKALAHPARIAILSTLLKKQTCICGDLVEELPLSQSTVSQHLRELKEAGLIKGTIEGVAVCYCINEMTWAKAKTLLTGLLNKPIQTNPCCDVKKQRP